VPEGSRALAGIGCHFMANWMERGTAGLIQMGGEGVDWVGRSRFTTPRMCSRTWATAPTTTRATWRSARPSRRGANITYKILYNDAVAMTGGQPVDGIITVDAEIARQVEAEGVKRLWCCQTRSTSTTPTGPFPARHELP
jgi:indolepyruvate ferredoxin oxidoreductase